MIGNSIPNWEQVINSIKESVILLDKNGIITNCNASFLKMINLPSTQVIGANCSKIISIKDGKQEACPYFKSKISKKRESSDIQRGDKWFNVDADPILDRENEISGFVQFMSDITERKQVEEALLESEEKFHSLFSEMAEGVYLHEIIYNQNGEAVDYRITETNPASEKHLNIKHEDANGKLATELYGTEEAPYLDIYAKVVKTGIPFQFEEYFPPLKKHFHISVYSPEKGKFATVFSDITERKLAEDALKMQNLKYQTLLLNLNGMVYRCKNDKKWTMQFVSAGCSSLTGYKPDELLENNKLSYNDIVLPEYQDYLWKEWQDKLKTRDSVEIEYEIKTATGDIKWVWERGRGIYDEKGQLTHLEGFITDITERKLAENALKTSEESLRALFMAMTDIVLELDHEGRYLDIAPTSPDLLYKPATEVLGKTVHEIFSKKEADEFLSAIHKSLYEVKIVTIEYQIKIKNKLIWFEARIAPKTKDTVLFIAHNITERKQSEDALKKEKEYYHSFVTSLSDWVWEMDLSGIHTYSNLAVESILGYRVEDVVGHHVKEFWGDSEITPKSLKLLNDALSAGKGWKNVSGRFKHKNGSIIITESTASPIYNSENKLIGYRGIDHDITERKHAGQIQEVIYNISNAANITDDLEKLISRIHKELGAIIDTTNFYIALYDHKKEVFTLPFLTDVKDKTITFPAGKTLTNYVRKTQKPLLANKKVEKKLEKSGDIERFGVDSKVWLGVPLKVEGKIIGVLAVQSYTDEFAFDESDLKMLEFVSNQVSISIERKRTELALQENEKRYKYLFNQSPTSIWEEDFSEVYKYLTSLKKSGIKDLKEYFENNLDEVKKCSEMVRVLDINEMTVKLFNAKSKDDLITNLDSIFTEASLSPFIDQLCTIAENQTSYNGETVNTTLDGELLNVFIRLNVVPGYEKDYSRVLISLMDITGQKKAEEGLRKGRERLKLLNQIIRHDLSNDFIVIKSAVNIFRRSSKVKMIDEIERRADKSLATIDTYRKYESFIDSNADLIKIEAAELINDIIIEFPKIKFTIEGKCNVFADDALNSIFTNLITNSIKHGNASTIDIKISTENNMCEIIFADNGTGIQDKIKNKIFNEGFFYGKAGHTGIGLHIVKKTIERYGGTISVEDNTPNGTVFIINLRQAL